MDGWALLTVVALLAVFAALSWWVRRVYAPDRPAAQGAIAVLGRHQLGPDHQLWLLDVAGQSVLVGSGRGGVHLLSHLDPPETPSLPADLAERLPRIERWRSESL